MKLWQAAVALDQAKQEQEMEVQEVIEAIRDQCQEVGLREVARRLGVDPTNLAKVLSGQRSPSHAMLATFDAMRSDANGFKQLFESR